MYIPLSQPDITELEKKYVMEVLDSNVLSFGEKLDAFEKAFREKFRVKYAVATNSGTSALHTIVKALNLQPGDEVITTPFSFIASSNCFVVEGATPVFVDIDPKTLNIDPQKIEEKITAKTKAILPVHVFGQPCPMDEIMRIAKKHNLYVIEDACEAIGAKWKNQYVGTFGDAGVFAFYPNKQITTGEGGMIVTNDENIYEAALSLRNQGRAKEAKWLVHERIGFNYRMSELEAAVGLAQIERLKEILTKREEVANRYKALIQKYCLPVETPAILPEATMSWFVFVIILPKGIDRSEVMNRLLEQGIETRAYFPSIHLQPAYQSIFGFQKGMLKVTEEFSERTLAIPFHTNLTYREQEEVICQLARLLGEKK